MINEQFQKLWFCVLTGLECVFSFKCVCLNSLFIRGYSLDCLPSLYCFLCADGEEKSVPQPVGCSPHKIQLCEDITPLSPSSALSQLRISLSPKRAVKSRRR
jgi:hypothetical protein